jgi:hypothetical protein
MDGGEADALLSAGLTAATGKAPLHSTGPFETLSNCYDFINPWPVRELREPKTTIRSSGGRICDA